MAHISYNDQRQQNRSWNTGGIQRNNAGNTPPVQTVVAKELPVQYVDAAEQVIAKMNDRPDKQKAITSTKIRKLFGLFIDLYNEIKRSDNDTLTESQMQVLTSARVRIVYECGREKSVKEFVRDANLLEYLKSVGNSRQKLMKFYNYFEALVAYHRFYFGDK